MTSTSDRLSIDLVPRLARDIEPSKLVSVTFLEIDTSASETKIRSADATDVKAVSSLTLSDAAML